MGEVEVTPAELVDAGAQLSAAGTDLFQDPQVEDASKITPGQLSGKDFPPGQVAERFLTNAAMNLVSIASRARDQCLALSSALNIVAEAYHTGDLEEAVAFAFVETDEEPVSGLNLVPDPNDDDMVHFEPEGYEPTEGSDPTGPLSAEQYNALYGSGANDPPGASGGGESEGQHYPGEHYADAATDRARSLEAPWVNHDHYEPPSSSAPMWLDTEDQVQLQEWYGESAETPDPGNEESWPETWPENMNENAREAWQEEITLAP